MFRTKPPLVHLAPLLPRRRLIALSAVWALLPPGVAFAEQTRIAAAGDRPAPRQDGEADQADGVTIPLYPTQFPAPQVLRYELRRGMLSGTGELSWRRDPPGQQAAAYELKLQASIGSLPLLTQISRGGIDKAGLAPLRFTDQRLRGTARAVTFLRQRRVISFSDPASEFPLLRGTQDRLSWMIQLPAILAAAPQRASPGQQVTLYVVGARGDASVWTFNFVAKERVVNESGPVATVKLAREARKPNDTVAEVWLDPADSFLPVRARIGNPDDGAMLELMRTGV